MEASNAEAVGVNICKCGCLETCKNKYVKGHTFRHLKFSFPGDQNASKKEDSRKKISIAKKKAWADKESAYRKKDHKAPYTPAVRKKISEKVERPPTIHTFRRWALKNLSQQCYICEIKRTLVVHHKNHNRYDNLPSNLIMLCCGCHIIIHRYAEKVGKDGLRELRFAELQYVLRKVSRA